MHKVSVIVPNYNHAPFLEQRLDSIFNQTFQDFEVILLDDCSTDNSTEILSQYAKHPKVSYFIINKKNSGSTFKQWKKGVELSKGEYIWIAESDDYADATLLQKLLPSFSIPTVGIAYCQSNKVDENGAIVNSMLKWTDDIDKTRWQSKFVNAGIDEIRNYLSIKNTIPNASAVLLRREAISNVLPLPLHFKMGGDKYMYAKILESWDIAYFPEHLNFFRTHRQTVRTKIKDYKKESENIFWTSYLLKQISLPAKNRTKLLEKNRQNLIHFFKNHKTKKDKIRLLILLLFYNKTLFYFVLKKIIVKMKNRLYN